MLEQIQTERIIEGDMKCVCPRRNQLQRWRRGAWLGSAIVSFVWFAFYSTECDGQPVCPGGGSPTTVFLDSVHPDPNSIVSFTVTPLGSIPHQAIPQTAAPTAVSMYNPAYEAQIDLSSMGWVRGRFTFVLYLNHSNLFEKSVYSYQIAEDATGVFNDTVQTVNIRIGPGGATLVGTVPVPLHSLYGSPHGLADVAPGTVHSVETGSASSFTIELVSQLDKLGATLGDPTVSVTCGQCLQQPILVRFSKSQLTPQDHVFATFTVTPNTWKAISATRHLASDKHDADLNLSIPLTADQGGSVGQQLIPVHIRFSPPLRWIAVSILMGGLLGALIRMGRKCVLEKRNVLNTHLDWWEFSFGLVYAWVYWGLVFLVFSNGETTNAIIGIKFDPTQLIPSFLLCVLAGGWAPPVTRLEDFAQNLWPGGGNQ